MVERYSRSLSAKAIKPFSVMNRLLDITPQEEDTPGVFDNIAGLTEVTKLPENVEAISEIDYRSKREKKETTDKEIWNEMLETVASLALDGKGATYGMYIEAGHC
jgi:hypothetical protein